MDFWLSVADGIHAFISAPSTSLTKIKVKEYKRGNGGPQMSAHLWKISKWDGKVGRAGIAAYQVPQQKIPKRSHPVGDPDPRKDTGGNSYSRSWE